MNWSWILLLALLAGGCRREQIKVYTVPKEQPAAMAAMGSPTGGAQPEGAAASAPQLRWKTPDGWKEGAPSEFRVASFHIKGTGGKDADVSVIPLPGGAGGDFSNVNRWRNQVGLEPVTEAEFQKLGEPVAIAGQPATLYDQAGDSLHILAAVQRRGEMAWFFKMTGDPDLVAQQKPNFIEFLQSVQFATAEPAMPAGHPDIGAMPVGASGLPAVHPELITQQSEGVPPGTIPSEGRPKWIVPADWKEVQAGQFLVAKFVAGGLAADGNKGQAAVNISTSPGDGGGLAANVNRWRKQLGLGELTGDEFTKSVTTAGTVSFVEMTGAKAALVGAIVTQPGQTWFYKLMGDAAVVAAQKSAFTKFVEDAKY